MDENKFKKFKKFLDTGKMTDKSGTKVNFNKLDKRIKTIDLETAKSPSPSKHSKGGLKGNQKKIAAKAPPPNKIDEKDFAVLRAEKAKGRGMGLQDESVQPGKVMKAKDSKFIERRKKLSNMSEFQKRRLKLESKKMGGVMKAKMGVATDYKKYLKGLKKATDSVKKDKENKFIKRRMKLMGMPKLSKGSEKKLMTPEERADYVKKAKVSLRATAESLQDKLHPKKSDRLFSKHKKMGGGMMQRPMGYKSGMGPAGAAGPSAGRPGGRRPMQQGPKKRNSDDLVVIFSTKDGPKKIKRSDLDNMSAPEKKMGGGMMKKYSKGGGADTGKQGEMKSKIAVGTMRVNKILGRLKDRDRLTQRDIEAGKELINQKKFTKRMGGGMIAPSQRPGYSKGIMVKARGCKLGRTRPTKIT